MAGGAGEGPRGEAVAGEANAGTLRYLLIRPVARTQLLFAKLVAVVVYTVIAVLAVALTGFLAGILIIGKGDLSTAAISVSGTPLTTQQLLGRAALMVIYIGWSMLGVAAVSLFLSTCTDSALAAALGGLATLVASTVLVALDAAGSVRDWLPTRYWLSWVDLFRDPILWHDVDRGILVQAIYIVVFLGLAWANFTTRDVRS